MKKILSLFLSLAVLAVMTPHTTTAADSDEGMSVSFINCSQGDSILIQSEGENMLVDAGKATHIDMIESYLGECNIEKLDYVVSTHFDEDHIGGMPEIYEKYQVDNSVMNDFVKSSKAYSNYINAVNCEPNSNIIKAETEQSWSVGAATVRVIYTDSNAKTCNDSSIVLRVDCGRKSLLLTGDISSEIEKRLINENADIDVDVLKVAHHGSKYSTSQEFLSGVTPEYSVISVSEVETQSTYKHPSPETLLRLSDSGSKIYRTDKSGTVKMDFCNGSISCNSIYEDIENDIPANSLLRADVILSENEFRYNSKAHEPSVAVYMNGILLKSESDVRVSTVYITASGSKYHYSSLCSNMKSPKAVPKSEAVSKGYTACSKCVVDEEPDYYISYSDNVNVGTASVIINANGAYCGEKIIEFAICECPHENKSSTITSATPNKNGVITEKCSYCNTVLSGVQIEKISKISLSAEKYTYDGKAKKPGVIVKDSNGKTISASNYTVTYSSNKNVGKASAKITFKGNYSGTKTLYFAINPKATTVSTVSAASKGFTVKWKKQATQTTGYVIQYSTDKNFKKGCKTVTVSKNSTTSKKITKLSPKKKYFVRIRTYKTVSGTKYYSTWSKSKSVTTKK